MKRIYKFRAWIPTYDDDDNAIFEMTYDLAFEDYEPINDLLNQVEHLMQFTGLKDKNGVDIYEGDIIRYPNPKCWGIIEFGEYHWSECDESEAGIGFYINRKDKYRISTITTSDQNVIEIIGNIYSNPELL